MLPSPKMEDSSSPPEEGRERSVLLIGQPAQVRGAKRVMQAVADQISSVRSLAEAPEEDFAMVVADWSSLDPAERGQLVERYRSAIDAGNLILQLDEPDDASLVDLFAAGVRHVVRGQGTAALGDLRATARKMLDRDLFGTEKYLGWGGRRWEMSVTGSRDKALLLELCGDVAVSLSLGTRRSEQLEILCDELITNALYNAPTDDMMRNRNAQRPRTDTIELHRRESVNVQLVSDGERLALSVCDPFGSLPPLTVTHYLSKCLQRGDRQVDNKPGGAGLGLYYSYKSVSSLVVNIEAGVQTEMIGFINLCGPAGAVDREPHSFNLFVG